MTGSVFFVSPDWDSGHTLAFSVLHCIPSVYIPVVRISNEDKMETTSKRESGMAPSAILSIIGGALMVIGGLLALSYAAMFAQTGMPGFGMMGGGVILGGWGILSGISAGLGAILIVGGYSIHKKPKSASGWGVAILVTSIVGLFGMSGFFVGPIIGIIGGILALTKK